MSLLLFFTFVSLSSFSLISPVFLLSYLSYLLLSLFLPFLLYLLLFLFLPLSLCLSPNPRTCCNQSNWSIRGLVICNQVTGWGTSFTSFQYSLCLSCSHSLFLYFFLSLVMECISKTRLNYLFLSPFFCFVFRDIISVSSNLVLNHNRIITPNPLPEP